MNNLYLIYGTDYSLIKREIDRIKGNINDIINYNLEINNLKDVLDDASMISFFGDKKVVIGENAYFLTSKGSKIDHDIDYLKKYIESSNENIVILTVLEEKLDDRKKIVKLLKDKCNVINKLHIEEKNLPSFIIEEFKNLGYEIDYNTSKYFNNYVGNNIDIILSEIKKMCIYKDSEKLITKNDIDLISSKGFKDNIFDFTDAIMKKNYKKINECYNDLIKVGEEPIKIISLLSNQFIFLYQVKVLNDSGKSSSEITNLLKVHPYRVKLALDTDYLIFEIKDIIENLFNLDYEIKSGKTDKYIGLKKFLFKL